MEPQQPAGDGIGLIEIIGAGHIGQGGNRDGWLPAGPRTGLLADTTKRPGRLASVHDLFPRRFALMMTPQILMEDDFRHGLDLTYRWAITRFPPRFSADDDIVSTSDRGLYVKAAGTNAQTGEPVFSETATGEDDHVKWVVDTQHRSSHSMPGFDAVPGHELQTRMWVRGRAFGTAAHPFGSASQHC